MKTYYKWAESFAIEVVAASSMPQDLHKKFFNAAREILNTEGRVVIVCEGKPLSVVEYEPSNGNLKFKRCDNES